MAVPSSCDEAEPPALITFAVCRPLENSAVAIPIPTTPTTNTFAISLNPT